MPQSPHPIEIRPLQKSDLEAVVAIDSALGGRPRRWYFERRLASALRDPKSHLQVAASDGTGLVGYALGRVNSGEYGRDTATALLESIGVAPAAQGAGVGRRLLAAFDKRAVAHQAPLLVTQVDWRGHAMLRFLASAGFTLAPRVLLERQVSRVPLPDNDEALEFVPNPVRLLTAEDFAGVVRVDRLLTGRDRSDYFRRKFDEVLQESAMCVSLAVEAEGQVVGFAMARVDMGDFGRVEASASLDTLGVDPAVAGRGVARDLLTQMIQNLDALHVERLETEVAHHHLTLMRFFHAFGFQPSQRLVFQAPVSAA